MVVIVLTVGAHAAAAPVVFVDWNGLAKERYELRAVRKRVYERLRQEGFEIVARTRAAVVRFVELSGETLIVTSLAGRQETRLLPWRGLSPSELAWMIAHKVVELVRALWAHVLRPDLALEPPPTTTVPIQAGEIASPPIEEAVLPVDTPAIEPLPPLPVPPLPPSPTLPFEFQVGGGALNRNGTWSPSLHFGPKISSHHGFTLSLQGAYVAGSGGDKELQALVGSGYRFPILGVMLEIGSQLGWMWGGGSNGLVVYFPLTLSIPLARYLSLELLYAPGLVPPGIFGTSDRPAGACIYFDGPPCTDPGSTRSTPTIAGFRQEISLRLVLHTW
jgi:hypothetical protein